MYKPGGKELYSSGGKELENVYIYPENLKAKAMLWLWELKDVAVIGIALLLAAFALAHGGSFALLIIAALYAFLTIRVEDYSVLDFLRFAAQFLILKQQYYVWEERRE